MKAVAEHKPDLLFLDVQMPKLTGFDVLEWVQGQPAYSNVPVIVLSTSDVQADRDLARKRGASAYYVKPLDLGGLMAIARTILSGKAGVPSKTR